MRLFKRLFFILLIAAQVLLSFAAEARTCLNPQTLNAMRGGQLSPVRQFVAVNECMDNCVRQSLQALPGYLDPYVVALPKAQQIRCIMDACYQETTLLTILPLVQQAMDQEYAQRFLATVMSALQQNGCRTQLDPLWISLIMGR